MRARLFRRGRGLAVCIPNNIAISRNLKERDFVEIEISGCTVQTPPPQPTYGLSDLLALVAPENLPDLINDRPRGEELI